MIDITLKVRGVPKAQPRTAATAICPKGCPGNCGGRKMRPIVRMYTPDKSGAVGTWKAAIMLAIKPHVPPEPHGGAFIVDCTFYFKRPQRLMRKCDPAGCIPHTQKPDKDNLEKAALDAITETGFWTDDCLVYTGTPTKYFTAKGQGTGAKIVIRSLELPPDRNKPDTKCPECGGKFDSKETFAWAEDNDGNPTIETMYCPHCGVASYPQQECASCVGRDHCNLEEECGATYSVNYEDFTEIEANHE